MNHEVPEEKLSGMNDDCCAFRSILEHIVLCVFCSYSAIALSCFSLSHHLPGIWGLDSRKVVIIEKLFYEGDFTFSNKPCYGAYCLMY